MGQTGNNFEEIALLIEHLNARSRMWLEHKNVTRDRIHGYVEPEDAVLSAQLGSPTGGPIRGRCPTGGAEFPPKSAMHVEHFDRFALLVGDQDFSQVGTVAFEGERVDRGWPVIDTECTR